MWNSDYFTEIQREQQTPSTTSFKLSDFHLGLHLPNVDMDSVGCQCELSSHHGWLVVVAPPRGDSRWGRLYASCWGRPWAFREQAGPSWDRMQCHLSHFFHTPPRVQWGVRGSPTSVHNCPDWCLKTIYANVYLSSYMNICINTCMNHKNNLVKSETMSHN